MKLNLFILGIFSIAITALLPIQTEAHGEDVLTFTATTTEGYIIDVDYGGLIIEAGVSGTIYFNLFTDALRLKEVEYTDLWVRIVEQDGSPQGTTIFAGPVARQEFGQQGFLYVFPKGGDYTLYVRYNQGGDWVNSNKIETSFPLEVYRNLKEEQFSFNSDFFIGVISGFFIAGLLVLPLVTKRRKDIL